MITIDTTTNHVMRSHLVKDGYLTLAWPKDLPAKYLAHMRTLIDLQISVFEEAAARLSAGDLEYASWFGGQQ